MALLPGTRVGPYEVSGSLGAGGMGEVYRARDTRLNRDVALKVLPDVFAQDPHRLARFRREAQVLASLNHTNIAAIHGLEELESAALGTALVLELVEGPTLADRLARAPLPVDEALRIARQVADALEAAHERGIVHRDLKPANIKVRDDGTVKVLDFGLAKAFESEPDSQARLVTQSPTLTSPAMTHAGVILGTAAYMAPEQARGKNVDKRVDIWAFGVVLFESLTGERMFDGIEVSDTLALVLTRDPDWVSLPATTPLPVQRLLRRCLEKDPKKRLADIADARLDIDEGLANPSSGIIERPKDVAVPAWRRAAPWAIATAAVAALLAVLITWAPWRSPSPVPSIRLRADLGTTSILTATAGAIALSPDGRTLAFVARAPTQALASRSLLHVQELDQLDARALPGTEGSAGLFFSPDGREIAFFADGALRKVSSSGGGVVSLCEVQGQRGGAWDANGTIVFASSTGLWRVSAAGGAAEPLMAVKVGEPVPSTPQTLPGGAVLYSQSASAMSGDATLMAFAEGKSRVVLQPGGNMPRYLPSGHLTFIRDGTLFAVPLDLDSLEVRGSPAPIIENVTMLPGGGTIFALSQTGLVAYQPTVAASSAQAPVVWLDRAGAMNPLRSTPAMWAWPRVSPDGRRLAMAISDGRQMDIWVYEWERDILTRITTDPGADLSPVWTPDGTRLAFGSNRGGIANLYWQRADGTGEAQRLTENAAPQIPDSFHPDGRRLLYHQGDPATGRQELGVVPIEGDETKGWKPGQSFTFIGGPFLKASPRFSPDGRWVSYAATDTTRWEIYVQPFPGPGGRVQVTNDGGNLALWSMKKNELYYASPLQQKMMAVPYTIAGDVFAPAKPQQWSAVSFSATPPISTYGPGFDLHPDGLRFAVAPAVAEARGEQPRSQLVFVFNFFDELLRVAPRTN